MQTKHKIHCKLEIKPTDGAASSQYGTEQYTCTRKCTVEAWGLGRRDLVQGSAFCHVTYYTYNGLFLVFAKLVVQLEVGRAHHCLVNRQVWQKLVILHDVARHFAELAQVSIALVHSYRASHRLCSVIYKRIIVIQPNNVPTL